MNSDAKIIVLYVEGLPEEERRGLLGPLWDYARTAGIEPGPYKKAKRFLKREGYLHQWSYAYEGGRWATAQILANAPITPEEAKAVWASREHETVWSAERPEDGPPDGSEGRAHRGPGRRSRWGAFDGGPPWEPASSQVAPSDAGPTAGRPGGPGSGGYLPDGQLMARSSHLPTCAVGNSNDERMPFGNRFAYGPLLADESDTGFWSEPPEWMVEQDPVGGRVPPPDAGPTAAPPPAAAPVQVPAPARVPVAAALPAPPGPPPTGRNRVPESVPVPERVPVDVPVAVPVRVPAGADAMDEREEVWTAQMVAAEEVLLSLKHVSMQLRMGEYEARKLVDKAAEWLRRGMSAADMRYVLSSQLPPDGVRSAVGFVGKRLVEKMPPQPGRRRVVSAAGPWAAAPGASRPQGGHWVEVDRTRTLELSGELIAQAPLVECEGPGDVHMFRAYEGHTKCGDCRQEEAFQLWAAREAAAARKRGEVLTGDGKGGWRDRLAAIAAEQEEASAQPGQEAAPGAGSQARRESGQGADARAGQEAGSQAGQERGHGGPPSPRRSGEPPPAPVRRGAARAPGADGPGLRETGFLSR